jgi:hypothetical protein
MFHEISKTVVWFLHFQERSSSGFLGSSSEFLGEASPEELRGTRGTEEPGKGDLNHVETS